MAFLGSNGKLAAVSSDNHEEHPRNDLATDTNVPRNQQDYIIQLSEEIQSRVKKKLSHEFRWTESRILGTLSKLNGFFFWTHKPGLTLDPFRRHPGIQTGRTREQMRFVPRIILILKCVSLRVSPHKNSAQTRLPTGGSNPA